MKKDFITNSKYEGWIASILFHILLSLIFLFVVYDNPIDLSEYANLTFSNYNPVDMPVIEENEISTAPPTPAVVSSSPRSLSPRSVPANQSNRQVDLPTRRMTEYDVNRIPIESQGQLTRNNQGEKISTDRETIHGVENNLSSLDENILNAYRPGTKPSDRSVGQKVDAIATPGQKGGDVQFEKPYAISWEGVDRGAPLNDPSPQYPPGVNVEGKVRIKITVLPDGTMGDLIPLQKLDATLESVTIKTLKTWRFRSLKASEPQVNQTAVITYNFILQ
jgi:protein TonB